MKKTITALALVGLLAGCGGSDGPTPQQMAALEEQVAELETRLDSARDAAADAAEAASEAEAKAKAAVKADADKVVADRKAFEAQMVKDKAALEARAKEVGAAEAEAAANSFAGDGVYIVGDDIKPGTYKSAGSPDLCYWARKSQGGDILENHAGAGPTVVVVRAGDFSLEVQGCAEFQKTG